MRAPLPSPSACRVRESPRGRLIPARTSSVTLSRPDDFLRWEAASSFKHPPGSIRAILLRGLLISLGQVRASDNGYKGAGGTRTASLGLQVTVRAVNDAPEVSAPPGRNAVPGEITPLPGFVVIDPDTVGEGRLQEAIQRVRATARFSFARRQPIGRE